MNDFELELIKSNKIIFLNNLLYKHQFSEEFLIKNRDYYDSWHCLKTQTELTPEFCFKYLYDNNTDGSDNWTDFYDIYNYFKEKYTFEKLYEIYISI